MMHQSEFLSKICFKELAHTVVGAGKSEICRAGQQAGSTDGISRTVEKRISSSIENLSVVHLRPSDDWIKPPPM